MNLQKKLGPLPLWQWIAIGAALGLAVAYYRSRHGAGAQDAAAAATPSDAEFNPIDPTTGLPISGGFSTGPATDTGTAGAGTGNLTDLLSNFQALEGLLAGLQEISPGPGVDTGPDSVAVHTGTKKAAKKTKKRAKPKAKKKTTHHKNPGHTVTHHGHGKKTASSSAPHNSRQHHNVQPPSHQRHEPTKHHSAQHPAARLKPRAKQPRVRRYPRRAR